MWYDPQYRAYIACAVDGRRNFTAMGLDFRCGAKRRVLQGVYPEIRLCENEEDAVVEMVQGVLDRAERNNPGLKCRDEVVLALSGLKSAEADGGGQEMEEWLLALKLQVKRVFLIPERRAGNLSDRCPALVGYMAKNLHYTEQDDIRRNCCGALLAAIVDAQGALPEDQRFRAEGTYRSRIKDRGKTVAVHMTDWFCERFFIGLSSWERHAGEEGSFRALWLRILRFMSTRDYEDYTELDDTYRFYFQVCRERFMENVWDVTVDEELGCDARTSRALFEVFQKKNVGLLSPGRFDGVKLAEFIRFITRYELEKIMAWYKLGMDEPISAETVRQVAARMGGEEFRREVRADFRHFADCHAERTWSRYVETENFLDEMFQAVRLARDVLFDRIPAKEGGDSPYQIYKDDHFVSRIYDDHAEIIEDIGEVGTPMVIPAEIFGKPVRKAEFSRPIGSSQREFRVEEGVEEIRVDFGQCSSLEVLEIPKNVRVYAQPHAGFGFREYPWLKRGDLIAGGTLYAGGIDSWEDPGFVIPEGVHEIEYKACSRFEVVDLVVPGSVEIIGESAFQDCPNLKKVRILDGVTLIKRLAFAGCPELETVVIPESVLAVGDAAFFGCDQLRRIEIAGEHWKSWDMKDIFMSGIEVVAGGYEPNGGGRGR